MARLEKEYTNAKTGTGTDKNFFSFEKEEIVSSYNGHSKAKIALLCFFLGAFGVHNFVMGEKKKGIVKIIATYFYLIGTILSIVDLIKIIKGTYKVDKDAYF